MQLEPELQDLIKMFSGEMSISWANLMGTQPQKLRRFGEIDPRLAEKLDPVIQHLDQLALELTVLFDNHSSTPVSSDAEK